MTLQALRCFVEVAKHLSFTRAAELLFISQPAVSHQIRELEREMDVCLLERSRRSVMLTPAGTAFFPDAADLLERMALSVRRAQTSGANFTEELRIGYPTSMHIRALPDIFRQFKRVCPSVHIVSCSLDEAGSHQGSSSAAPDVLLGDTLCQSAKNRHEAYHYATLYKGHLVCVVPPEHSLASRDLARPQDIERDTIILLDTMHAPDVMSYAQRELRRHCPQAIYDYSSSAAHTFPMIQGGLGIAIMPDFVFDGQTGLRAIPFGMECPLEYGIFWHKQDNREKTRQFIRIAKSVYKNEPPLAQSSTGASRTE